MAGAASTGGDGHVGDGEAVVRNIGLQGVRRLCICKVVGAFSFWSSGTGGVAVAITAAGLGIWSGGSERDMCLRRWVGGMATRSFERGTARSWR